MNTLTPRVPFTRVVAGIEMTFVALGVSLFLSSCAGPRVHREATGAATIKVPAMNSVTITITKDNAVTVESRPVPIWESAISGLTGGLIKALANRPAANNPNSAR